MFQEFGDAIKSYMDKEGISQVEVVRKTSLSKQAMNCLLNGKRGIYIEDYVEICDALAVEYDFFLPEKEARACLA